MRLSDFNYNLPKEFIAQKPVSPRDHSKLMIINNNIQHKKFYNIIDYLRKDDVLVINELYYQTIFLLLMVLFLLYLKISLPLYNF